VVLKLYLIANIIGFVCALFGFIYGGLRFFRPRQALYAQMITLALGCCAFGRLFYIVRLLSSGYITGSVQLGFFGVVGSFMFFFSSNFGTLDSLLDDGSKGFRKYRLIPLIAPAVFAAMYVVLFLFADVSLMWKILGAVLTGFAALSTYFNLKHLIFPDVDFGVVKCLRPYNFLVLIYSLAIFGECVGLSRDLALVTLICCIVSGIISAAMMPSIVRGLKKWRT
jgi:hypothetical protein